MKKTTEITAEGVLQWLGDGFSSEDLLHGGKEPPINELAQVVADIVNGEYPIALAKQDIAEHQSSYS